MVSTWIGMAVGLGMAPWVALAAILRGSRVFHPRGPSWRGDAVPAATSGPEARAGERLAGAFTVRFSGGSWADLRDDVRDILGCTIRLSRAGAGDQDLLLASFRTLLTVAPDLRTSDTRNVLRNTFYSASWSRDADLGVVTWRIVPSPRDGGEGPDAAARLDAMLPRGVTLGLEASADRRTWRPVLSLALAARAETDDARTWYSPFVAGRGIEPVGFVNGIRKVVYPVGRWARGLRVGPLAPPR